VATRVVKRRNTDPEVNKLKSLLSNAVKSGKPDTVVLQYRRELREANIIAAAKKVAARLPELTPEGRERVRSLLSWAAR
jgi:hypothetical protein